MDRRQFAIERAKFWLSVAEHNRKPMTEEKPSRLVPDWRDSWRWWSIRLAILAPIALEAVWYVLSSLPPELRAYVRLPVFVLFAVAAGLARIWQQNRK